MAEIKLRIIERKEESKADAFAYGLADTLGRAIVWFALVAAMLAYIDHRGDRREPPTETQSN